MKLGSFFDLTFDCLVKRHCLGYLERRVTRRRRSVLRPNINSHVIPNVM